MTKENVSQFDPTRPTVGKIYRDAQINNTEDQIQCGDMNHELLKEFVDNLNEALRSNPFEGRPFYVQIAEKWDYQMEKALRRMVNKWEKRPYPENGTAVFWTNPKTQAVHFCWDIPHHSEFPNIISNKEQFFPEPYESVMAIKEGRLDHFGFRKTGKVFKEPLESWQKRNEGIPWSLWDNRVIFDEWVPNLRHEYLKIG